MPDLNPHDNYSGWSALRYGVGETLFKYNDNMEVEPWLATDYEFVDDTTVKITLRDGVKFSSGRDHGCGSSKGMSGRSDRSS